LVTTYALAEPGHGIERNGQVIEMQSLSKLSAETTTDSRLTRD